MCGFTQATASADVVGSEEATRVRESPELAKVVLRRPDPTPNRKARSMRNPNPSNAAGFTLGVWILACFETAISVSALATDVADKVTPLAALKAEPFSLGDVRLLDGPFRHAMELQNSSHEPLMK